MSPKITVVIPTYNRAKTLPRAINSVINQTLDDWELLIVDDGSDDGTLDFIVATYGKDPRIKFYSRPATRKKGANACRNIGIENADGEYIALLDSDDEWKPEHLKDCIALAQNTNNFNGCYSGAIVERGNIYMETSSSPISLEESHFDFILRGNLVSSITLFFITSAGRDIRFDEELQRSQDWDFFIRFGQKYSWNYNPALNVIIHWGSDDIFKKVDLNSHIQFYNKHKHSISPSTDTGKGYLYSMYKKATLQKDTHAYQFYRSELKNKNHKNDIAWKYPFIYRHLAILKSRLMINRLILWYNKITHRAA